MSKEDIKKKIIEALVNLPPECETVTVSYSGCGDSGDIEDVIFENTTLS